MTLLPKHSATIIITKEALDPNQGFFVITNLSFIQIHVDLPQFPVLNLPSIGVKGPQDYNDTSNGECKHFVIRPTISTFLTATTVEVLTLPLWNSHQPWEGGIVGQLGKGRSSKLL